MQKLKIFTSMHSFSEIYQKIYSCKTSEQKTGRYRIQEKGTKGSIDQIILKLVLSYWF